MIGNEITKGSKDSEYQVAVVRVIQNNHSIAEGSVHPQLWLEQKGKVAPSFHQRLKFSHQGELAISNHNELVGWLSHNPKFSFGLKEKPYGHLIEAIQKTFTAKGFSKNVARKARLMDQLISSHISFQVKLDSPILHTRDSFLGSSIRQPQTSIWGGVWYLPPLFLPRHNMNSRISGHRKCTVCITTLKLKNYVKI